jgi:AcrR family transcriptional regulator
MADAGPFAVHARALGKSARTRARLMDAATGLFAQEGFESASVNRIAKAADVVNGTFYLHFRDKDDIAAAVAFGIAAEAMRQIDDAVGGIEDAIERIAAATRLFIEFAYVQPEWGLAFFRAVWFFRGLRESIIAHLRADLERAAARGAFTIAIDDFVIDMFGSMTLTGMFGRVQGIVGPETGSRVAELQLRMLGVPPKRAAKAAQCPLPPLQMFARAPARHGS